MAGFADSLLRSGGLDPQALLERLGAIERRVQELEQHPLTDALAVTNDYFITATGTEKEKTGGGGALEPVRINIGAEGWDEDLEFLYADPRPLLRALPGGGMEFTGPLAGEFQAAYKGYRDSFGNGRWISGRIKFRYAQSGRHGQQFKAMHRMAGGVRPHVVQFIHEAGTTNLTQFLRIALGGTIIKTEQLPEKFPASESNFVSTYGPHSAWSIAMFGGDPDLPGNWGMAPWAYMLEFGSAAGQNNEPKTGEALQDSGMGPQYAGDVGFAVEKAAVGDVLYSVEFSPMVYRAA